MEQQTSTVECGVFTSTPPALSTSKRYGPVTAFAFGDTSVGTATERKRMRRLDGFVRIEASVPKTSPNNLLLKVTLKL